MNSNIPREVIIQGLLDFIRTNLIANEISVDAETELEELGIDSFSIIEIMLFIERKFGYTVPDSSLTKENVKSVSAIASFVFREINTPES
jgi:acyl carrier protein